MATACEAAGPGHNVADTCACLRPRRRQIRAMELPASAIRSDRPAAVPARRRGRQHHRRSGAVGLALASASARIRGMEADFGTALLRARAPRRSADTGRAGAAASCPTRGPAARAHAWRPRRATRAGCKGNVRLLANTAAAAEFLPEPLAAYLAAHPEIDVDLEERPSHEIVAAVAGGLADAGIVADTVDLGGLEMPSVRARSAGGRRPP